MPHLSPLNWLLTPIIMMTILFLLVTIIWWELTPVFPLISSTSNNLMTKKWAWW